MEQELKSRNLRWIILGSTLALLLGGFVFAVPWAKSWLQQRSESTACGNHIVAITMTARMWANDHNERLPPDVMTMSNELNSPRILQCPGDHSRSAIRSWTDFKESDSNYEVVSPGAADGDTNTVYLRCRFHGHVGYADATVFDGKRRRRKSFW